MEQPLPFTVNELELMRCLIKYSDDHRWLEDKAGVLYEETEAFNGDRERVYKTALCEKLRQHYNAAVTVEIEKLKAEPGKFAETVNRLTTKPDAQHTDTPETIAEKIGIPQIAKRFNELVSGKSAE